MPLKIGSLVATAFLVLSACSESSAPTPPGPVVAGTYSGDLTVRRVSSIETTSQTRPIVISVATANEAGDFTVTSASGQTFSGKILSDGSLALSGIAAINTGAIRLADEFPSCMFDPAASTALAGSLIGSDLLAVLSLTVPCQHASQAPGGTVSVQSVIVVTLDVSRY